VFGGWEAPEPAADDDHPVPVRWPVTVRAQG
jgi:hypothetical protein